MKLNERHLMQLAAVLDAGGVSEGAALLGLTQPAVSRALAMLEARVGEPLFLRGKRPLQGTVLGHQLAAHGRSIIAASRGASVTVQGFVKGTRGVVRVGGVPFFMDALISRMIAEFQNLEPDISVVQSYGNLPELSAALDAEQIDLGIVPLGLLDAGPGFDFTPILRARNVVACRTAHPLLRKDRLQISDLTAFPWIAPLPGSPLLSDLHAILLTIGMSELNIRYAGGSLMSVVNYMTETNALAVLPHSVVFALRPESRVTVLPLDVPQPDRSLGILRRIGSGRGPAVERFATHLMTGFETRRALIQRNEAAAIRGSLRAAAGPDAAGG